MGIDGFRPVTAGVSQILSDWLYGWFLMIADGSGGLRMDSGG